MEQVIPAELPLTPGLRKNKRKKSLSISAEDPDPAQFVKEVFKRKQKKEPSLDKEEVVLTKSERKKRAAEADRPSEEQKARISAWIEKYTALGVQPLVSLYETQIKKVLPKTLLASSASRASFDQNKTKNRYMDVVCLEPSRVALKDGRGSDYIHANYVRHEALVNTFICTQGPKENTLIDFWRMVVQEKARHIFMLCELEEQGKKKCERYWAKAVGDKMTFGDFVIETKEVSNPDAHVILTKLSVHDRHTNARCNVEHHQWITWPDKSVPKSLLAVFRLLKQARSSKSEVSIVHCSAGIGRTGTFVLIEVVLQKLLYGCPCDLVQTVLEVREQRMSAVQIEMQFVYIVAAIGKYALTMGAIGSPALEKKYKEFVTHYETEVERRLKEVTNGTNGTAEGKHNVDNILGEAATAEIPTPQATPPHPVHVPVASAYLYKN